MQQADGPCSNCSRERSTRSTTGVSLVDPNTGGRVRIQTSYLDDGTKVRVTKGRLSSQAIVPRPDQLLERKTPRGTGVGKKDTTEDLVREVTYLGPR